MKWFDMAWLLCYLISKITKFLNLVSFVNFCFIFWYSNNCSMLLFIGNFFQFICAFVYKVFTISANIAFTSKTIFIFYFPYFTKNLWYFIIVFFLLYIAPYDFIPKILRKNFWNFIILSHAKLLMREILFMKMFMNMIILYIFIHISIQKIEIQNSICKYHSENWIWKFYLTNTFWLCIIKS